MFISARTHYATLAMLELALRADDSSPVAASEITDKHGIPGPFLVQILRTLRTAGWVQSIRGSHGGYRLCIDPAQITLQDIVEVVGCQQETSARGEGTPGAADEILQSSWDEAAEASRRVLSSQRLCDIVERCRHGTETMFYI